MGAVIAGVLEIFGIIALYFMIKLLIRVDSLAPSRYFKRILNGALWPRGNIRQYSYKGVGLFLSSPVIARLIGRGIFNPL